MNAKILVSLIAISMVFLAGCAQQSPNLVKCPDGTLASDASLCSGTGSSSSSSSSSGGSPPPLPGENTPTSPPAT